MRNIGLLLLISSLALAAGYAPEEAPDADNTARNEQKTPEGLASTDTPLDQGNSEEDLRITSSIRSSIVNDKSLSANAHNIKIVTSSGNVTLRGPVKSAHEKSKVEAYAKLAGGVDRIDNMLEIETRP
jgi:hyperosmotically inducible protein